MKYGPGTNWGGGSGDLNSSPTLKIIPYFNPWKTVQHHLICSLRYLTIFNTTLHQFLKVFFSIITLQLYLFFLINNNNRNNNIKRIFWTLTALQWHAEAARACQEHIINLVVEASQLPVLDCERIRLRRQGLPFDSLRQSLKSYLFGN